MFRILVCVDSKCQEIGAISTDANLTVRRLALEMQDLNGQVENVLHDHESSSHRPSTAASTASNNQYAGAANDQLTLGKNLFKMKKSWAIICDDLQYGLDQLLISGISDVQNDSFYQTMLQFRKKLCDILPIWEHDIGTTLEVQSHEGKMLTVNYSDVLVKVHPTMYQIQVMADSIVTLEK